MKQSAIVALAAVAAVQAVPVAQPYGQCGGNNYSGDTTCPSDYSCVKVNDYYSQCQPGSSGGGNGGVGATTTAAVGTATAPAATNTDNPLAGYEFYANPYYASEVSSSAVPTLSAKGSATWAAKATEVAKVGSFTWLDTRAKVPTIADYAADVQKQNAAGAKLTLPLVVYDLPERDCAALASNGELSLANNGSALYKDYINSIKAQIDAFPDVFFTLVIEPDSLANLVTNTNVAKCANAESAYKELTAYAIKTLDSDNVIQYLDAGHAGWLGWPANIGPAAKLFASVYSDAGKPASVRGLATNVANYNAWSSSGCASYQKDATACDEKTYVTNFAPLLEAAGFPAHFVTDTGRNGVQPTKQEAWGDWCNVIGTGFGVRPTTETNEPLLDAFVWVKPGGECDGTSDTTAVRYDAHCGLADALKPAPEAGTWFEAYFEQLLVNANPPF